jgi:hypothetical protein
VDEIFDRPPHLALIVLIISALCSFALARPSAIVRTVS